MVRNKRSGTRVVVIGLGRFGASLGRELCGHGSEVLGLDTDAHRVQRYADELTHTAIVDSTDVDALAQLGVPDFGHAVVAIGSDLESSILTTSLLSDFGIENIWAKATSRQHGKILERVGAHHVVLPEHDMGERVAHLVTGGRLRDGENSCAAVYGGPNAPRQRRQADLRHHGGGNQASRRGLHSRSTRIGNRRG